MRAKAVLALSVAAALVVAAPLHAETVAKGSLRLSVTGKITPQSLPRKGSAPVAVTLAGKISSKVPSSSPPQLRRIVFAINSNGHLALDGLPICRVGHIQPSTNREAMDACGSSYVGQGHFAADVRLPEQSPFPSEGKMLAFNGLLRASRRSLPTSTAPSRPQPPTSCPS